MRLRNLFIRYHGKESWRVTTEPLPADGQKPSFWNAGPPLA